MSAQNLFASVATACLLTVVLGGAASNVASAGQIFAKLGESARNDVIEIKHRGPRFYLPIAPSYLAYDYPYYYSRGYYPKHIRPGYIYYGYRLTTTPNAPIGSGYASPFGGIGKKIVRGRNSQARSVLAR